MGARSPRPCWAWSSLPISFARHVGQQPIYYNQIRGRHGTRYADLTQEPAFAFGDGLSYATVEYSKLRVTSNALTPTDTVYAEVSVRNTGHRPVRETIQVYVSDSVTSASWADKELKAYRQIDIEPGQISTVHIDIPVADCTVVDADGHRRVEPGSFELLVGPSSRDATLLRAPFTVTAP